jgi:hypothetical protein
MVPLVQFSIKSFAGLLLSNLRASIPHALVSEDRAPESSNERYPGRNSGVQPISLTP